MASSLIALSVDSSDPKRQEWVTPDALWLTLDAEYHFTLDAAASVENFKVSGYYFDKQRCGLTNSWAGQRVWCNPPFNNVAAWVEKAFKECANNGVFSVLLVPARTDSEWFLRYSRYAEKHFFRGRVQYVPPPGVKKSSCSFASMLLVFSPDLRPQIAYRDAKTGAYIL